jgi:hypothetical protein
MTSSQIVRLSKLHSEATIALRAGNIPLAQLLIAQETRLMESVYSRPLAK